MLHIDKQLFLLAGEIIVDAVSGCVLLEIQKDFLFIVLWDRV